MAGGCLALLLLATARTATVTGAPSNTYTQTYSDKTKLRVQLIGEGSDVLRVTVFPPGTKGEGEGGGYRGWMPAEGSAPSQTSVLTVTDHGAAGSVLSTTAGLFALTVGKSVATTKLSISGTVVSEELRAVSTVSGRDCLPPGWKELDQIKGASSRGTMAATLTGTSDDSCLRQTRSLRADEDLYGFGQVPQAGLSSVGDAKLLATSSRNQADGPSHAPAPFYVSLQGKQGLAHGVLLNTGQYSMFDIGNATKSEVRIHSPEKVMDYFLLVGPTPAKVIEQMTAVCGRSPLPPPWALGFKYHTKNSVSQEFVEATVSNFSAHKTPLAHVVIENYFNSGHDLDPKGFTDPASMVKTIEAVPYIIGGGCKVVLWLDPHVHKTGTALGQALQAANCTSNAWQDSGGCGCSGPAGSANCGQSDVWVDRCIAVWRAHVDKSYLSLGIAGFKLDQDDGDGDVGFADNITFASGLTGAQMHNTYGFAFQKMFHEMYQAQGKRAWMQSRGNYLGGQRYSTSSYSDGYTYATYVKGLVNSGFTGGGWAPEVRYATCDADYARRVQLMLLGSQSQFNAWERGDLPFDCTGDMWDMFQRHYDLRARLFPYLYTAFYTQSITGFPIVGPLPLSFPAETNARHTDDQFMLGPSLMFAPAGVAVVANPSNASEMKGITGATNATTRSVLFPGKDATDKTVWWDYWTASVAATASTTKVMHTPILDAPLYVRGGSIIPMLPPAALPSAGDDTAAATGGVQLVVALDAQGASGKAEGVIFVDDMTSLKTVEAGNYLTVAFAATGSKLNSTVTHAGAAGKTLSKIQSVEVWGVSTSVAKVMVTVAGKVTEVPKGQWTSAKGSLHVSGLMNVSMLQPFELAWE